MTPRGKNYHTPMPSEPDPAFTVESFKDGTCKVYLEGHTATFETVRAAFDHFNPLYTQAYSAEFSGVVRTLERMLKG